MDYLKYGGDCRNEDRQSEGTDNIFDDGKTVDT